ncbi:MAG: hypothetical protein ACI4W0_05180 [Bacilli bacterium]
MTLTVENIKYSIFGKYDFMEATPDNVSQLYGIFGKDKFLPNMVQMIQIEQPKNIVTKVMRPQFVNEDLKCTVTFLPERIDIEIKEENDTNLDIIIGYYTEIIEKFQLKINRVALNTSATITVSTEEELQNIRRGIINEKSYPYGEDIIEWGTRNVSRKKCENLDEVANVGQNIGLVSDSGIYVKQIKVDTDINTLAERNTERFDALSCKLFFVQATAWNKEILENLEGIV